MQKQENDNQTASSRPIRFRAWDKRKELMVDDFYFRSNGRAYHIGTDRDVAAEYQVMQFTGLHDKNGEHDIYEGDMLWSEEHKEHYEVAWEACGFIARSEDDMFDLTTIASSTVVAGNIYENKGSAK